MQAFIVISSTSDYVSVYLLLFVFCRPYAAANFYQRALLANALTSALRLHQRLPRFQLSRTFLAQALQEDSCHYLLYSLILVNSYPITSILIYQCERFARAWFCCTFCFRLEFFFCILIILHILMCFCAFPSQGSIGVFFANLVNVISIT